MIGCLSARADAVAALLATATTAMEAITPTDGHFRHLSFFADNTPAVASPAYTALPRSRAAVTLPDAGTREDQFLSWLLSHCGLGAGGYRAEPLRRRLQACLRVLRVSDIDQARGRLEDQPHLLGSALDALLIGVSGFFRDPDVFDSLRTRLLPALGRGRDGLRVWSAGCSNGAELYSIAMLLDDLGLLAASDLLGTDCRRTALALARAGQFPAQDLLVLEPAMLCRYFAFGHGRYEVKERLRTRTRWVPLDLLRGPAPPGQWDLVLCRNVSIYLCPEATASLWRRLTDALRPGGVLVTGKAERPPRHTGLERLESCIYRCTEC